LSSGGNLDLLVTDDSNGSILVLLGKGDGTFPSPVSYPADAESVYGASLTVADFNGDGKLDVVTSGLSVVELLGNGDGTLQPAVDYYRSTAVSPYFYLIEGDFNGDGSPDLAVGFNFVFSVFLNAAGTTRQATTTTVQTTYNGCGNATVTASVASSGQVPTGTLTLQLDGQYYTPSQFGTLNSSGSASDDLSSLGLGAHTITVVYSGDSLTQASAGSSSVTVPPPSVSTTQLTSVINPSMFSQPAAFRATVTSSPQDCVAGIVTFLDGTTVLGTSSIVQGGASFSTSTLTTGTHFIKAEYAGTTYVDPSVSNVVVQVVTPNPDVQVTPDSLSFPSTPVGQTSAAQPVTLVNTGTIFLTITSIRASGDFSESNNCGTTLGYLQARTINVNFTPTQAGSRSGAITVTDNASNSPQTVTLTGQGQDFSLTSSSSSSATVSPGQTASYAVSISPHGGFSEMVALSCSGAPAPSTCSVSPSSMKLSGTSSSKATVTVTTVGSAMGTMQPMPPAGRTLDWSIELSGTFGLAILGSWLGFGREIRRRMVPYGYVLLLLLCGISMPACGGGSNANSGGGQTPAGSYALTVTGTFTSGSARLTHTTKLTLIVQ
jgi:Bacterial Ig-like domain (group 3)/FG-GAP-like repeat/Abnormal spindle-like microcephaly-assoc'd, ASPM-SPD-2-Hydin